MGLRESRCSTLDARMSDDDRQCLLVSIRQSMIGYNVIVDHYKLYQTPF